MNTTDHAQDFTDTIAAIATAPGEAGIAIVRISGPEALRIADDVFAGTPRPSAAPARRVLYGGIRGEGTADSKIDEVILLVFRAPRSYTREDVVEIQGHGGQVSVRRILRAVLARGARLAEPGEFTRRAFLNGRLDLVQAEAVADLIRAQSERAASGALEQLAGSLSVALETCYDDILSSVADLEATMDFSEDELPDSILTGIEERLREARKQITGILDTWDEGHLLREGARVVISGNPNVGKSTLMNRLLGRERSIVTDIPGTTRDTIEEQFVVNGIPIRIIDTAGLRDADCAVEREGIRRAESAIEAADLNVIVLDGSQKLTARDASWMAGQMPERALVVVNKADLGLRLEMDQIPVALPRVVVSLLAAEAADQVKAALAALLQLGESPLPHATISERHRAVLDVALAELDQALGVLVRADVDGHLLAAEHLRAALMSLGTVTGREYSDELLDSIFSRFCIGK